MNGRIELPLRIAGALANCAGTLVFAFWALMSPMAWPDPESDRDQDLGSYFAGFAFTVLWVSALWTCVFFARAFWKEPFPRRRYGLAPLVICVSLTVAIILRWWIAPRIGPSASLPFPILLNAALCTLNFAYAAFVAWRRTAMP